MQNKIITTSWDDGHPLDFRIAELLDKYSMQGTFYIPKHNTQNQVMSEDNIALLGKNFEIGGHTLNHVNLKKLNNVSLVNEVEGCYSWLHQITGVPPVSFCPPFGAYNLASLKAIHWAGFKVVRTTQLLSTSLSLPTLNTTLQMYNHSAFTYARHLMIRGRIADLKFWIKGGAASGWPTLIDHYLDDIQVMGGCFHIWGHSWEIERYDLWKQVEAVFKHLANRDFKYLQNGDVYNAMETQNKPLIQPAIM